MVITSMLSWRKQPHGMLSDDGDITSGFKLAYLSAVSLKPLMTPALSVAGAATSTCAAVGLHNNTDQKGKASQAQMK